MRSPRVAHGNPPRYDSPQKGTEWGSTMCEDLIMRVPDRQADKPNRPRSIRAVAIWALVPIAFTGALILLYFVNDRSWASALTIWIVIVLVSLIGGLFGTRLGRQRKR